MVVQVLCKTACTTARVFIYMEIIRIPTAYALQMKHLSDSDISYVMKSIFLLSTWEVVEIEDNMRWWLVQSIWRETVQLENKARAKKWEKQLIYQLATLGIPQGLKTCDQVKSNQTNSSQSKSNQNTTIVVWSKDLEPTEKIDNRNQGTQRIMDIVQSEIQNLGYLYEKHAQDRNRATIIAKRQSDWGIFIKDTPEPREEEIIRQIINYSNSNEFVKKIRSVYDFHEKWKSVANAMKQSVKETPVLHPNPLCRF